MSTINLRSRIEEDHLTCTICYNVFTAPKALPCLHTFCEHCLREYVVSRGYEPAGEFPCPICRKTIQIPVGGLDQFADNHLVKSLSDTVDQTKTRPTPKPRRSLQPKADEVAQSEPPPPYSATVTPPMQGGASSTPVGYGMVGGGQPQQPPVGFQPPPYYQVPPNYPYPAAPNVPVPANTGTPELNLQAVTISDTPSPRPNIGPPLYPTIPPPAESGNTPCSEGLQLKFGKKGASVTDFHKPIGLAVSDDCDFVVTDMGGNRIFVFDYRGQPKKAFHSDCRIKDVAINSKNEILVVVNKPGAALRCYDMNGRFLGEHGKFITHEETESIALLFSGGVVVTGSQNHSVYILTDQYKLSSKFGRKGNGDGYFQSPGFVTTDSKNHIIVSDNINNNVQVFNSQGKFKMRFGGKGSGQGQLLCPMGVVTDADDNIIVADSGNCRVEMFTSKGTHSRTIVSGTNRLGEDVRPINVAMTPRGNVAVLMKGNYFAEVRVYNPYTNNSHGSSSVKDSTTWYLVN